MARACVLVLVSIIALAAGAATIWAAATMAPAVAVDAEVKAARRDTTLAVSRFYSAANERLDTGSPTALRTATTPDFAFHAVPFPDAVGLDAVDRFLGDLDDACPDCLLSVDRLVIDSNAVSVILTARTTAPANAYGLPVSGPLIVWTGHDILRVKDGLVAEVWGRAAAPAAVRPLLTDILFNIPSGLAVIDIVRLTVAQNASLAREGLPITRHVVVESGSLGVALTNLDPAREGLPGPPLPADSLLGPGEHVAIPAEVGFEFRNAGASPTNAWVVSVRPFEVGTDGDRSSFAVGLGGGDWSTSIRQRALGAAVVTTPQVTLTLGRLTLGVGAGIDPHTVMGTEILSVGAGPIEATASGGGVTFPHGEAEGQPVTDSTGGQGEEWTTTTTLHALDTAVIRGGVAATRNVGPAPVDLVLILIAPTDINAPAS